MKFFSAAALLIMTVAGDSQTPPPAPEPTSAALPEWEVDPTWPPTLPNDWILGDIRGLFVDESDHLWVVHMPSSLTRQEIGAAEDHRLRTVVFPLPRFSNWIPRATSCKPGAVRARAIPGLTRSTGSTSITTVSSGSARATDST